MATESLTDAILRLNERSFTHGFRAEDGRLRDLATGKFFDPEVLTVAEVVRFEGESDPGEQADGEVIRRLGSKT